MPMYVRYPGYNRLSILNKRTRPQKSRACCLIRVLYFPFFSTSESPAGEFVTLWFLLFFSTWSLFALLLSCLDIWSLPTWSRSRALD